MHMSSERAANRRFVNQQIAADVSRAKIAIRQHRGRELLARQAEREKTGFYGRPVAESISPSRSRLSTRRVKKGAAFGRVISTKIYVAPNGAHREVSYHATKGWRSSALGRG